MIAATPTREEASGSWSESAPTVYGCCNVCGIWGDFQKGDSRLRESFVCPGCGGSMRYRHQSWALLNALDQSGATCLGMAILDEGFCALRVYEPGLIGPFRRFLARLPHYTQSYYWPEVEHGTSRQGIRCEDLQALTFPDQSFDVVITSDIFEHVRRPLDAFAEVARVLKPGGIHCFTIPMDWPHRETSRTRVDTSGAEDVHVLEPVYHGSPTDPDGSLVYTDYGLSLLEDLEGIGTPTELVPGLMGNVTFISRKPR